MKLEPYQESEPRMVTSRGVVDRAAWSGRRGSDDSVSSAPKWTARFDGHPNPFAVFVSFCTAPECQCTDATLRLVEATAKGAPAGLDLEVLVQLGDGPRADEDPPDDRSHPLAQELLAELPAELLEEVRRDQAAARQMGLRRQSFQMSLEDLLSGRRASWNEVFGEHRSVLQGGRAHRWRVEHEGATYLVEDEYCLNPECDCRNANLVFLRTNAAAKRIEEVCAMQVSFDGQIEELDPFACSAAEARALHGSWFAQVGPSLAQLLAGAYADLKDVGARLLLDGRPPHRRAQKKMGRNDPCHCGSGKKYKKCCLDRDQGRAG